MSQGNRRLAAIMFTDMVGYTALGQRNESLSLALVEEQRRLVRPILTRHNGREVKTIGDAFLVEFPNAVDAVRCAYDIQRTAREFNLSMQDDMRIHLRVGVHVGEVVESQGDISGDAVNVASRIESLAEDGGVCITRQVYDHVQNKTDLQMESLGQRPLKNVAVPVEVYRMVMPWESEKSRTNERLDKKRIAVLPFSNLSPDPNDSYFADGMTEELITTLSKVGELTLVARTSVMQYRNSPKRASAIAQELNTGTLIEGSVRKAANKVRITIQLLDGQTENHVWAENYDRDLSDIFEIQTDVAKRVSDVLRVKLLPAEKRELEKRPTNNKEAYVFYLKGRHYWNERTPSATKSAIDYFHKAIELDSSFALAFAGLADCYVLASEYNILKPIDGAEKTKEFANRALELDPSLAEPHAALGSAYTYQFWGMKQAGEEFERSIELNPNYPTARQWYAKYLSFIRRFDESVEQHRKAVELDPLSPIININLAEGLVEAGQYKEGIEQALKTTAMKPEFALGHYELGQFYVRGSEYAKAEEEFKKSMELAPDLHASYGSLGHLYGLMGRRDEAVEVMGRLRNMGQKGTVSPSMFALIEYSIGDYDAAFEHLEQAFEERSSWMLYIKEFPGFEDIRADPRFIEILKKMGFSDAQIQVTPKPN